QLDLEPEPAALAGRAFNFELAAHQPGQTPADRQPEAGAFDTDRRIAHLVEQVENFRQVLRLDADSGVFNQEAHARLVKIYAECHFTAAGVLDRVVEEIHQYLAQPALVSAYRCGKPRAGGVGEGKSFGVGASVHDRRDGFQQAVQIEVVGHQVERARLDLG